VIRRTKVAKSDDVKITFTLPVDEPTGTISVVGDFNDWIPGTTVLAKRANGTRSAAVTLPAGSKYRFRYLGENGHWFDDDHAERDGDASLIIT
jgi:1,4-alpha-glucan branching enzyme